MPLFYLLWNIVNLRGGGSRKFQPILAGGVGNVTPFEEKAIASL